MKYLYSIIGLFCLSESSVNTAEHQQPNRHTPNISRQSFIPFPLRTGLDTPNSTQISMTQEVNNISSVLTQSSPSIIPHLEELSSNTLDIEEENPDQYELDNLTHQLITQQRSLASSSDLIPLKNRVDSLAHKLSLPFIEQSKMEKRLNLMKEIKTETAGLKAYAEGYRLNTQSEKFIKKAQQAIFLNASAAVPLEFLSILPIQSLESCDFKPDDDAKTKSIKISRLGIIIAGFQPDVLFQMNITESEKNFLSASCFKEAGKWATKELSQSQNASKAELIELYASAGQYYYWSYSRLKMANSPMHLLEQEMLLRATMMAYCVKIQLQSLPTTDVLWQKYWSKIPEPIKNDPRNSRDLLMTLQQELAIYRTAKK